MRKETVFQKVEKIIIASIKKIANEHGITFEELLKKVFKLSRISDCKILERIENATDSRYIVIPVIIEKSKKEQIEKILELNSKNLREILAIISEKVNQEPEEDIDSLLKKLCPFGDCNDDEGEDKKNEEKPKRRGRRGRKKKTETEEPKLENFENSLIPKVEEEEEDDDVEMI